MDVSKRVGYQDRATSSTNDSQTLSSCSQVDFEWAVKLNRAILDFLGLWPKSAEDPRQKFLCNIRTLITFVGVTFGVLVPSIHSMIRIRNNIMLVIDNLQFTLPAISCSIRIAIFWWKKEAIVPVVDMIAQDWMKSKSVQERDMMIKRARIARIIIMCACCVMGIAYFFIVVLPGFGVCLRLTTNVTDPGKPLPLQTYYIYDVTRRPHYELTFVSQAVYVALAIMSYSGIDNFLGLLVFHICGQLDILKARLESLDQRVNFRHALRSCVARHIRLLRAIAVIEDTYNMTLLVLFVYFGILFAFYGFRIISLFDEENLSTFYLVYLVSNIANIFAHMCLYCVLGEILMAQCNGIYHAAYSNKWYSMDPKAAIDLLPLLTRGARPVYFTAGKVFPVTMATFCSLLKTSAGYISVLHTTRR